LAADYFDDALASQLTLLRLRGGLRYSRLDCIENGLHVAQIGQSYRLEYLLVRQVAYGVLDRLLGLRYRGGLYQHLDLAQPSLRILAVGGIEAVSTRADASQPNDLLTRIQVAVNSTELVDGNCN